VNIILFDMSFFHCTFTVKVNSLLYQMAVIGPASEVKGGTHAPGWAFCV
jgi:hypothetical protein